MKYSKYLFIISLLFLNGCSLNDSQEAKDRQIVNKQQSQYAKGQPIPLFDWSLERHLVIELYKLRNQKVATHSIWRSDYGTIEYDCPSMGYGLPYDTSLTNPLMATREDQDGDEVGGSITSIGQPEPNGVFASTNTAATWVMCIGDGGVIEPHYVETKVTVFPYPVKVDYDKQRVIRAGKASVTIPKE